MADYGIILTIENLGNLDKRLEELRDDDVLMTRVHEVFKRYMNPYVPYSSEAGGGELANAEVTPEGVVYDTEYAHYQYEGIVYAPNRPLYSPGHIFAGWFTPAGTVKYPTDRELGVQHFIIDKYGNIIQFGYDVGIHPLATHHWDKAMLQDNGKNFTRAVRTNITRYLNGH